MTSKLSLPVVWSEDGGAAGPGRLDLDAERLHLDGGSRHDPRTRELALSEIAAVRIGRHDRERINGRRVLVIDLLEGGTISLAGLERPGTLHELAERLEPGRRRPAA